MEMNHSVFPVPAALPICPVVKRIIGVLFGCFVTSLPLDPKLPTAGVGQWKELAWALDSERSDLHALLPSSCVTQR